MTDIAIACTTPNAAYGTPLQARYRIYEQVPGFGGAVAEGAGDAAAAAGLLATPLLEKRPVAGIGFEPYVVGAMDGTSSTGEGRFNGVLTESGEWCSDTCGVMSYQIMPKCVSGADNTVTAGISVQGAQPTGVIKFTISNTASGTSTGP